MVKRKKCYLLSFPEIDDVVWEAIDKYMQRKGFSNTWLRNYVKKYKIPREGEMPYKRD